MDRMAHPILQLDGTNQLLDELADADLGILVLIERDAILEASLLMPSFPGLTAVDIANHRMPQGVSLKQYYREVAKMIGTQSISDLEYTASHLAQFTLYLERQAVRIQTMGLDARGYGQATGMLATRLARLIQAGQSLRNRGMITTIQEQHLSSFEEHLTHGPLAAFAPKAFLILQNQNTTDRPRAQ